MVVGNLEERVKHLALVTWLVSAISRELRVPRSTYSKDRLDGSALTFECDLRFAFAYDFYLSSAIYTVESADIGPGWRGSRHPHAWAVCVVYPLVDRH